MSCSVFSAMHAVYSRDVYSAYIETVGPRWIALYKAKCILYAGHSMTVMTELELVKSREHTVMLYTPMLACIVFIRQKRMFKNCTVSLNKYQSVCSARSCLSALAVYKHLSAPTTQQSAKERKMHVHQMRISPKLPLKDPLFFSTKSTATH